MKVDAMIQGAQDALAVSRVYGEPIQHDGVTLIPAAEVLGGAGGGSDEANNGGGGFGVSARPVGMWVIRGKDVGWEPAIDSTKLAMRGMLVVIVFLFVVRSVVKTLAGR
jgi:uncharacterized spore protein YtfJ